MSGSSKGYFARVMGTMWRHKRTSALSMGARGLWVTMLSWSADQMSDGLVEAHAMEMIFRGKVDKKLVDELIAAQVIARAEEGWQLRDWDQHNITRAKYETQLKQGSERVNKSRARSGESVTKQSETPNETPPVTRYKPVTFGDGNAFPSDQEQEQEQEQDRLERRERARVEGTDHALRQTCSTLVDVWKSAGKSHDPSFANQAALRRLADALPDEAALRAAASAYLRSEDEYVVKAGHPLALFSKQWSRYVETRGPNVRPNAAYQNRTMTGAELFATGGQ